ncbi:histidine kinase N-terminal 7TM domain-containing diguanylate cyclase [Pararhodospirillum oryzae]|uniref:diguanylate cyclase n=1 Tax=Pararhodospirillum oryzae TaxID=478448 RepID=A0A512H3S0_9PROT|nr:diguanylate cyclase [Pararhodospirillum oryzae]GEO80087.1 GGDEF domain-containing protein [Pararhodospirillum oryzae]
MLTLPEWTPNLPGFLLVLAAVTALGLVAFVRRLSPFHGRGAFVGAFVALAWWCLAAAVENLVLGPADKLFWAEMAWPGIMATVLLWTAFLWSYCKGEERVRAWPTQAVLWGLPALTWGVALTNDFHHLMYVTATPMGDEPGAPLLYEHGLAFFLAIGVCYFLLLVCLIVLIDTFQKAPRAQRPHYLGLTAAMAVPWVSDLTYLTGLFMPFGFDPTPFSFIVTAVLLVWMIGRHRLLISVPVALRPLLDALPDAVMVLDPGDVIAEANRSAQALTGCSPLTGRRMRQALPVSVVAALDTLAAEGVADAVLDGEPPRHVEIRTRPLSLGNRPMGRVVILTDITCRKQVEQRLTEQLAANLALQQQLREQATRDSLTGLHNRHYLEEARPALLAGAKASGRPLSVVVLDLDHFKHFNDTWGHRAGDAVLRAIARFLIANVRQDDVVVRVGGEEILVLLPDTDPHDATVRVEHWREVFGATALRIDDQALHATFSAGVAAYPNDAPSWEAVIEAADAALYRSKDLGRNRVCRWHAPGPAVAPAQRAPIA